MGITKMKTPKARALVYSHFPATLQKKKKSRDQGTVPRERKQYQ